MNQIAPSQGTDVRRCLRQCSMMRKCDQEVCRHMCLRQFWGGIFEDLAQASQETDTSQSVWMNALKDEFESRFGAKLIVEYRRQAAVSGSWA